MADTRYEHWEGEMEPFRLRFNSCVSPDSPVYLKVSVRGAKCTETRSATIFFTRTERTICWSVSYQSNLGRVVVGAEVSEAMSRVGITCVSRKRTSSARTKVQLLESC